MQILTMLDAQGAPQELKTAVVTLLTQRIDTEEESVWALGAPIGSFVSVTNVCNLADLLGLSDDMLARYGVQRVAIADAPEGQYLASYALSVAAGVISATPTYEEVPPAPIPEIVSRMQLRRQFLTMARTDGVSDGTKFLDQVDAGIAGAGNRDLIEYWNQTSDFHRHHPQVEGMLSTFNVTDAQADAAWSAASLLS